MTINISTLARNDAGDAIVGLVDAGSNQPSGYLEIRTGSPPSSPQVAATGTLLATLRLSLPAFAVFNNGQASANPIAPDVDIATTGMAGWFRIYNRDNVPVIDGIITATGGGGDIEFDNINFVKGGTAAIATLVANMPS
jgi:hypothetical protein